MAVAEEEEVVFVPVLGSTTALCCDSPPLGVVGAMLDVGVVAVG